MKSSTGVHFIALDHIRAMAAFLVFTWHFTHSTDGYPVPFEFVPSVPWMSILDEGHTGVALFMTLSGYLFAKLLDGRKIDYYSFLWNRALRLLPLLLLVIAIRGVTHLLTGGTLYQFFKFLLAGMVLPVLPNGGWSITVEFHFYLILPLLLRMSRISRTLPLSLLVTSLLLRAALFEFRGEIQLLSYWTIVGRIDQFTLGMLAYSFRESVANRHLLVSLVLVLFMGFYWYFDACGGFYKNPNYPSRSPIWIWIPTLEGIAYAVGIAWYDNSFEHSNSRLSKLIGAIGEYSYSIYLLHFYVVFGAARLIHEHVMDLSNFYIACLWSGFFFLLMLPPAYVSFRFFESPFLVLRKRYIVS